MREFRSGSQILFGYLPGQTVDLAGRVWKVRKWVQPIQVAVDDTTLREELLRQVSAWERTANDGDLSRDLRRGVSPQILTLNYDTGVQVESFPSVWLCKSCSRVDSGEERPCQCGAHRWGQFHFVGYHDCGALREPWIPRCQQHQQARIRFPGTSSAAEILVDCPVCGTIVRRGLGMPNCSCGNGRITFTVHRAARVYTPRSVVIVNPPTPARIRELRDAGGAARTLQWVVDGMRTRTARELGKTRTAFVRQLVDQGFDRDSAEALASQALAMGQLVDETDSSIDIADPGRSEAEDQAVKIALATLVSRVRSTDLAEAARPGSPLRSFYEEMYPRAFRAAGLESVEFVDRFPVLTGNFGYTRGDAAPGATRLVAFRDQRGQHVIYADVAQTEALFIRLQPARVAKWLSLRGHLIEPWHDDRSARLAILRSANVPLPGSDLPALPTVGSDVLTLVHSYAHRLIRLAAVHAGLDRSSLSEFLVPMHLGFFVFAAARGGFVLGGLQALFENELVQLINDVTHAEHRCALDPGCEHAGGSCAACLHLGEPSCRWFNRYLDRRTIHGSSGYLHLVEF
jgi:hypothetical protein